MRNIVIFAAIALAAAACQRTAPIYNVQDTLISTGSGKPAQVIQVKQAILAAGAQLGWKMVETSPGHIEGTLALREHEAVVDIPYSATKYSIVFKGGKKLQVSQEQGIIHSNYNGWVQNLERQIRAELARM